MSEMAKWHTEQWAEGRPSEELIAEIAKLRQAPDNLGIEFDDIRSNHMKQTRIRTLANILEERGVS